MVRPVEVRHSASEVLDFVICGPLRCVDDPVVFAVFFIQVLRYLKWRDISCLLAVSDTYRFDVVAVDTFQT